MSIAIGNIPTGQQGGRDDTVPDKNGKVMFTVTETHILWILMFTLVVTVVALTIALINNTSISELKGNVDDLQNTVSSLQNQLSTLAASPQAPTQAPTSITPPPQVPTSITPPPQAPTSITPPPSYPMPAPSSEPTIPSNYTNCYGEVVSRSTINWSLQPHGYTHTLPLPYEGAIPKEECQSILPVYQNGTTTDDYAGDAFVITTSGRYIIRYWCNWDGATGMTDHNCGFDCAEGASVFNTRRASLGYGSLGTDIVTHVQETGILTVYANDTCRLKQYVWYSGTVGSTQGSSGVEIQLLEAFPE